MDTTEFEMTRVTPDLARHLLPDPGEHRTPRLFAWASDAGGCARAIALKSLGTEATDPIDDAGLWVTTLGHMIHDRFQERVTTALEADGATVAAEEPFELNDIVNGRADLAIDYPDGTREAAELKSAGGFKFKSVIGATTAGAEGPPATNLKQLALEVVGIGADRGRLIMVATEGISKGQTSRFGLDETVMPGRFPAAEWTATREELEPVANAELARFEGIRGLVAKGDLPRRIIPGLPVGAEVMSARRGTWQVRDEDDLVRGQGNTWHCDYCSFQTLCHALGAGRVPVERIESALVEEPAPEPVAAVGAIKMGRL